MDAATGARMAEEEPQQTAVGEGSDEESRARLVAGEEPADSSLGPRFAFLAGGSVEAPPRGVTEPDAAWGAVAAIACEFACAVCFVGFLNLRMSSPRQYSIVLANPSRSCTFGSQSR